MKKDLKLTVNIVPALYDFIDIQIESGDFSDASEYINHLIQNDKKTEEKKLSEAIEKADRGEFAPFDFMAGDNK